MKYRYALLSLLIAAPLYSAPVAAATTAAEGKAATSGKANANKNHGRPKTRQEAIARLKEQIAEIEKMTDAQWAEGQKKRMSRSANQRSRGTPAPAQ